MRSNRGFPQASRDWDGLRAEMLAAREGDNPWCHERSFSAAYFAGEDVLRCAHEAYDAYRDENGLFAASAYPSLAALERALIAGRARPAARARRAPAAPPPPAVPRAFSWR